jgi:hypothetical protein
MIKIISTACILGTVVSSAIIIKDDYDDLANITKYEGLDIKNENDKLAIKNLNRAQNNIFKDTINYYGFVCEENCNESERLQIVEKVIKDGDYNLALNMHKHYREDIAPDIFLGIPYCLLREVINMDRVRKMCYSYLLHQKQWMTYVKLKFWL